MHSLNALIAASVALIVDAAALSEGSHPTYFYSNKANIQGEALASILSKIRTHAGFLLSLIRYVHRLHS